MILHLAFEILRVPDSEQQVTKSPIAEACFHLAGLWTNNNIQLRQQPQHDTDQAVRDTRNNSDLTNEVNSAHSVT